LCAPFSSARGAGLRKLFRREWRPQDFEAVASAKMFKRGAAFPLLVQYRAQKA